MSTNSGRLQRGFQRAAMGLLVAAVIGSALAVGTVHTLTLCVVAGVLGLVAALAWIDSKPFLARRSATILVIVGVSLTLFTALQLVPVPVELLAKIAPANARVWAGCLDPLGLPGPSWAPISLDPTATRVEVLKGVAYLCAFLAAVRVSHRRKGVLALESLLVASAVVVASASLLHPALSAQKLFGIYTPDFEVGRHLSPLLNPNHLAGYLNIGFCIALSMALTPRDGVPRAIPLACAVLLVGTQLFVASRGGVAAMAAGGALVLWATRGASAESRSAARLRQLMPVFVALVGLVIGVLSSSEDAWAELGDTDVSKADLWARSLRLGPKFPLFGIGRGAFEAVFPAYRSDSADVTFTHPENIVAQWTSEWGLIFPLLAAVAIAYSLRSSAQARPKYLAGAWAAIVTTALHNLTDFNSELPAIGIAIALCAAIVVSGPSAQLVTRRRADRWSTMPALVAGVSLGVTSATIAWVVPHLGDELYEDRLAFSESVMRGALPREQFRVTVQAAMLRHPGEPYFPYGGATWALREGSESVVPWVSRTFQLFPSHGRAHLVLARWLRDRSPSQARLEYRLALEATGLVEAIVKEAAPLLRDQRDVLKFSEVSPSRVHLSVLEALSSTVRERLPAATQILDARLSDISLEAPAPRIRAAESAVRDLEAATREPWCDDSEPDCLRVALNLIERVRTTLPRSCSSHALNARVAAATGKSADAIKELLAAAEIVDDRRSCLIALVELSAAARSPTGVEAGLERLSQIGCSGKEDCAELYSYIASAEERRANPRRAIALRRKAYEANPENLGLLSVVAERASALGMHQDAVDALVQLSAGRASDVDLAKRLAAERNALEQERLRDNLASPLFAP